VRAYKRVCVHAHVYVNAHERKRMLALRKGDRGWRQGGEREAEAEREFKRGTRNSEREGEIPLGAPDIPPFFSVRFRSLCRGVRAIIDAFPAGFCGVLRVPV